MHNMHTVKTQFLLQVKQPLHQQSYPGVGKMKKSTENILGKDMVKAAFMHSLLFPKNSN